MNTLPSDSVLIRGPHSGHSLAPFELPSSDGRRVRLWDYRQRRNLALFFHHGGGCARCRAELARISRYYEQYRERDAEVLAIGPDALEAGAQLVQQLGLRFPLLSDPEHATVERQLGAILARPSGSCVPAVIVANRFEEIWAAWAPNDELLLPSQEEVLGWLEFVAIQCHNGCTTPEWELET